MNENDLKKVFIPELNDFGYQVDINATVTNPDLFVRILKDSELQALMESALKHEMYETCEFFQKEIDRRKHSPQTH